MYTYQVLNKKTKEVLFEGVVGKCANYVMKNALHSSSHQSIVTQIGIISQLKNRSYLGFRYNRLSATKTN